jgi:hypothetical protein
VKIAGHARTHKLDKEKFEIVAGGIKIRIPVANASGPKEQEWVDQGEESDFIGSTRGFTIVGPVDELEIRSTVPLDQKFCLTCYNTLGKEDMVSRFDSLHADVDNLQLNGRGPMLSLLSAKRIDPKTIEPAGTPVQIHIYPANATAKDIEEDQQRIRHEQEHPAREVPGDSPKDRPPKQEAYWRRREDDPPPNEAYVKGKA